MELLNFFDIPFSVCPRAELLQNCIEMIEEPRLHTLFFVRSEHCVNLASFDEEVKAKENIHWLPGDYAVSNFLSKKTGRDIGKYPVGEFLMSLAGEAVDREWEICILAEDRATFERLAEHVRQTYPYILLHGLITEELPGPEAVINEINSIAPTILLAGMHMAEELRFLEYDRQRTNARLCIMLSNFSELTFSEKPRFFSDRSKQRKLDQFYRKKYPWHIWA